ncbi:hypothetical protein J2Z60_001977 [Lactobacillus colini]|uniref:Integral membrane protein n=1 Tax=Lactobacillus colini TaxID=1819254 RepID=A0ABS4MHG7_9LACO|nr:hypothetical protein [Lactobacillus colini]MBP2058786.1 hypothetical protein [Lactobacillus colini]
MKKIDADQLLKRLELIDTLFQLMLGILFMYSGLTQDQNVMARMCIVSLFILLVITEHYLSSWKKEWFPDHDDEVLQEALGGNKAVTLIAVAITMFIIIAAIAFLFFKFKISLLLMFGIVIVAINLLNIGLEILIAILEKFIS